MSTPDPADAVRAILRICIARVWKKQTALAEAVDVKAPTLNQWLSGARAIDAVDLKRVIDVSIASTDHETGLAIAVVVANAMTGMALTVEAATPDLTPRVWEREVLDGQTVETRMGRAVLDGDAEEFEAAVAEAEAELRQRITAGRQRITGSAEGALRVVPR
jgi:hypothetical protein